MTIKYVLEWSQSTNNFHIQPLPNLLAFNQSAFLDNKKVPDYMVLMVGEKQAVDEMADHWRHYLQRRQELAAA
jgi:hypothetical protein